MKKHIGMWLLAFLLVPLWGQAQSVIKYRLVYTAPNTYEVYADVSGQSYNLPNGSGSQATLILPYNTTVPTIVNPLGDAGTWSNAVGPNTFNVTNLPSGKGALWNLTSSGTGPLTLAVGPHLLFSFALAGPPCTGTVRLYENATDPKPGGIDWNNYFFDPLGNDYYAGNLLNTGIAVNYTLTDDGVFDVAPNAAVNGNVSTNDVYTTPKPSVGNLTISVPPTKGTATLDPATGAFVYTASNPAASTTDQFTYSQTDACGTVKTAIARFTITVPPAPAPPVIKYKLVYTAPNTYEVYADVSGQPYNLPNGSGSQATLILPYNTTVPTIVNPLGDAGTWSNAVGPNTFNVTNLPSGKGALWNLTSSGTGPLTLAVGPHLLFSFALAGPPCIGTIRLYENATDPKPGGIDWNNYFFDLLGNDYYAGNLLNNGVGIGGLPVDFTLTDDGVFDVAPTAAVNGNVSTNDVYTTPKPSVGNLTISVPPTKGTATLDPATGAFVYTASNPAASTTDQFTYSQTDACGTVKTAIARFTITVPPAPAPPVIKYKLVYTAPNTFTLPKISPFPDMA